MSAIILSQNELRKKLADEAKLTFSDNFCDSCHYPSDIDHYLKLDIYSCLWDSE